MTEKMKVHQNEGYESKVMPLFPQGTNSTFFTSCCHVAITDGELVCPHCENKVIGWDEETDHKRHKVRWTYAYQGKK